MARIYLLDFAPQPLILSTEQAVGRGCANNTLDVKLIQFFIHATVQANDKSWGWFIDRKFTKPNIDGKCGPITQDWIERFQKAMKERGKHVIANGRIDPILGGVSETSSGGVYLIYMLNVAYYAIFGEGAIAHIANHPLFPKDVARTFYMHGRSW
jgi:hypothetical protein